MKLKAYTNSSVELKDSKRIYLLDSKVKYECPNCGVMGEIQSNIPILTGRNDGTFYCHVLYCDNCGHESEEKLYSVNNIGDDYIDLKFNKDLFNVKVYKNVEVEIKDE